VRLDANASEHVGRHRAPGQPVSWASDPTQASRRSGG
jgi:hypothetical protein